MSTTKLSIKERAISLLERENHSDNEILKFCEELFFLPKIDNLIPESSGLFDLNSFEIFN